VSVEIWSQTLELGKGRSLHIRTAGRGGPDIVLIHGSLTTGCDWLGPPVEQLSAFGRITIFDRPGHRLSARPRFHGSPRRQAEQLQAGLKALEIARPVLVAHSLGSMVALALAEQFPRDVAALVLVAPLAFPEVRPFEQSVFGPRSMPLIGRPLSATMASGPDRPILEAVHRAMFFPQQPPPYWQTNYAWPWMLSPEAGIANGEEFNAIHPLSPEGTVNVGGVAVPTRILVGDKDMVVRPETQGLPLARMMTDAQLTRIGEGGHMLHHNHTTELVRLVEDTVRQAAAAV
jgi:pimeloyl-ACP methyl ester carboxylesterase